MATYKTRGIVINRHNLGEADRIIAILTDDKGVIRVVARGVRKIKSRMAGHLELFSDVELMIAKGKKLDVITSARLQNYSSQILTDYTRLQVAFLCAEMINKLSGEREFHDGQFEIAQNAFKFLNDGDIDPVTVELWFKLRLLDCLGYKPDLEGCVICGASSGQELYSFNNDVGGIVCQKCKTAASLPISNDQIKLWRLALTHGANSLQRVQGVSGMVEKSLPIIDQFFEYTFSRGFKSKEIFT